MLIHLENSQDFEKEIKEGLIIVDFFATWCGPCKMLTPELEELSDEHNEIKIIKIDVDKFNSLAAMFNIRAVPTLLFYKDGVLKLTRSGYSDKDTLLEIVTSIK